MVQRLKKTCTGSGTGKSESRELSLMAKLPAVMSPKTDFLPDGVPAYPAAAPLE